MERILNEEEQREGKLIVELMQTMTEQEKENFRAFLIGAKSALSLKESE